MSAGFLPLAEHISAGSPIRCFNCDWTGTIEDRVPITDPNQRVEADEVCPVGQCPECGCCAYLSRPGRL